MGETRFYYKRKFRNIEILSTTNLGDAAMQVCIYLWVKTVFDEGTIFKPKKSGV